MGNGNSRLSASDVRTCIDSIEQELSEQEYERGLDPSTVVACLRSFYCVIETEGGNVVLPRPTGSTSRRSVVVPCRPRARSSYSASSTGSAYRVRVTPRTARTPAVEVATAGHRAPHMAPAEARRDYRERHAARSQRDIGTAPARDIGIAQAHDTASATGGGGEANVVADELARCLDRMGMEHRSSTGGGDAVAGLRTAPVFRGPPAQHGVKDMARQMEGR